MFRSMLQGAAGALTRVAHSTTPLTPTFLGASSPLNLAVRSMRVMTSLKKRCEHCYMVKRGHLMYIYCKVNPRHKARNGPKRRAGWLKKRSYA